jgi:hypothetical protein
MSSKKKSQLTQKKHSSRERSYRKSRSIIPYKFIRSKQCTTKTKPKKEVIQHPSYREVVFNQHKKIIPNRFKSTTEWCSNCNNNYNKECDKMASYMFNNKIVKRLKAKDETNIKESFSIHDLDEVNKFCTTNENKTIKDNIINYLKSCLKTRLYYQNNCIYDTDDIENKLDSHIYYINKLIEVIDNCSKQDVKLENME